jgi:hypothetical protein
MSFALFPSMPFVAFTGTVTSAWLNFVRAAVADAVDGVGGGTYNLQAGHTLDFPAGGGNITLEAPLAVTDGDVPVGGHLDVEGTIRINSGGNVDVKSGGYAYVRSGGQIDVKSGGVAVVEPGGFLDLAGQMIVADFGSGGGNGTILLGDAFGGAGHLVVTQYGDLTVQAGGNVYVTGTHTNPATITLTGDNNSPAGAAIVLTAGAGFASSANSPVSILDLVSCTQTGTLTKSGAGAKTLFRRSTFALTIGGTVTIADPTIADFWAVTNGASGSGIGTVALSVPGGAADGQVVTVYVPVGGVGLVTVNGIDIGRVTTGGGVAVTNNPAPAFAMFILTGGAWQPFLKSVITYTGNAPAQLQE